MKRFGFLVCAMWAFAAGVAQAQVTYVDKVPTVDELQGLLNKAAPQPVSRSRGIEWVQASTRANDVAAEAVDPSRNSLAAGVAVAMPINFDDNSSRMTRQSAAYVDVIAQLMVRNPSLQLTVEGHTNAMGSPQKNHVLAWGRAISVYRVLVERYGIDATRLQPVGKGAQEPLAGMAPNAPTNRRVQFRVLG